MSKRWIKAGATDQTIDVWIMDSSSTTGGGLTGLTHSSSGLTCYYRKGATGAATQLSLVTQTVGGAHSDGGFVAVDGTNMPGLYRLDLSDTMVAAEGMLTILLRGATNMAPVVAELEIVDIDIYDSVRLGLTALPNAAAEASGGLATLSAAQSSNGTIPANMVAISGDVTAADNLETAADGGVYNLGGGGIVASSVTGSVGSVTGNVGGNVAGSVNSVTTAVTVGTNNDKTGYSLAASAITTSTFAAGAINAAAIASAAITSAKFAAGAIDANAIATDAITSAELATSAINEIVDGVWSANTNTQSNGSTLWGSTSFGANSLRSVSGVNYELTISPNGIASVVYEVETAPAGTIADAVWDETTSGHTTAGTYGGRVLRATNSNVEVQVTGSNHVAADIHELQPGVITSADFTAGAIDANALAASAVGEIADGVWDEVLSGHLTAGTTGAALNTAAAGGGGGGGSTTVRMGPFVIKAEGQGSDEPLDINKGATHAIECQLVDAEGTGVDITGATLTAKVYNSSGSLVETVSGTISYAALGLVRWTIGTTTTNTAGTYTVTITRTTGASDTQIFGPLRVYVRDI